MKNGQFRATKGFIVGALAMLILSGTVLMANTQTLEAIFGVRVNFNGTAVQFDADSQPFVVAGRTFLPVRAIADVAGLGVDFDAATNTVLLTGDGTAAPARATSPSPITQSFFADSVSDSQRLGVVGARSDSTAFVRAQDTVSMGGQTFNNAMAFRSGVDDPALGAYSSHQLGGRYTTLVGTVGRITNSGTSTGSLWRIWGDGIVIAQFDHSLSDGRTINNEAPRAIEVDVTGVNVLTIEVTIWSHQGRAEFAFAGEVRP